MRAILPLRLTVFAFSLWIGTAASACLPELPPPPGWTPPLPPTAEERARSTVNWASDIVYGVVTRDSYNGPARFRVIHIYKGSLRPGAVIEAQPGWAWIRRGASRSSRRPSRVVPMAWSSSTAPDRS